MLYARLLEWRARQQRLFPKYYRPLQSRIIEEYEAILNLRPYWGLARASLALARSELGHSPADWEHDLRQALRNAPRDPETHRRAVWLALRHREELSAAFRLEMDDFIGEVLASDYRHYPTPERVDEYTLGLIHRYDLETELARVIPGKGQTEPH